MKKKLTLLMVFALLAVLSLGIQVSALDTVIGETLIYLVGDREHVRSQETNLGNLVCDVIREYTKADIAIYNGGGIRDSAKLGDITLEDAMAILAFNNEVETLRLSGADVVAALEHGVRNYPEASGSFLQVSGLRFYFDPNKPAGQRVEKVYVGGYPIDYANTYVVATNSFLAAGGDGYEVLEQAQKVQTFDITDQMMFIRHIQGNSPLFPKVEGRIVVLK